MSVPMFEFTSRAYPVVQVGSGASSTAASTGARWDVSLWDDSGFAEWAGSEPTWRDASCFAISADTTGGRFATGGRVTDEFDVGKAVIVFDNVTGWGSPEAAPSLTEPRLIVGQQIRVGVWHQVFGYVWVWRGFMDDVEPVYDASDWSTVAVRAIDPLGESGRPQVAKVTAEADDEAASTRLATLLDEAPWVTAKRDIATVSTGLVAATLDGKVLDLMRRCAVSSGGWVFGDSDGNVVFRGPGWLNDEASRAPEFVITNDSSIAGANVVCPSRWVRPVRRADVIGRVVMQPDAGDPETYESSSVIDDYGAESVRIPSVWTKSPTDRATIAARILATHSPATVPRIESVTVHAHGAGVGASAVDLAALVDAGRPTRLRCRHLDESGAVVFDDECFATGVRHHITRDEWTVEISLDRSDPFVIPTGPHYWDVDDWDQAQWN